MGWNSLCAHRHRHDPSSREFLFFFFFDNLPQLFHIPRHLRPYSDFRLLL